MKYFLYRDIGCFRDQSTGKLKEEKFYFDDIKEVLDMLEPYGFPDIHIEEDSDHDGIFEGRTHKVMSLSVLGWIYNEKETD